MPKGSSKSTSVLQRLLAERRQYEAWIARLSVAEDATPEHVRARVLADYQARLQAVLDELRAHADGARQTMEQQQRIRADLQKKEALAAEKLAETELRHAVGEYDEAQWSEVHKDALAELVAVREQLQALEADLEKLAELETVVRDGSRGGAAPKGPVPARGSPPPRRPDGARQSLDELAFIKSVTEDEKSGPSAKRSSGAHYQPPTPASIPGPDVEEADTVLPVPPADDGLEEPRTLKCRDCGAMNLATEWYCERCGAELVAL
jgi:hypothetical protein